MDEGFLVAAQLSSLPSQVTPITIRTTHKSVPLAESTKQDFPAEHATFCSVLDAGDKGTILLRLLHGGLTIEIASISHQVAPIHVVFPAAVLSSPGLFILQNELHLLVVMNVGSLHRVVIPIHGLTLWQDQADNIWTGEYLIKSLMAEASPGPVHVHGVYCVVIGMPNGCLLRLEAGLPGYDFSIDEWTETLFQHGSFLSSLSSFLPIRASAIPNGSEIISITSPSWLTDIGCVWSLSRDRTLRLWKAKIGCTASMTLAVTYSAKDPSSVTNGTGRNSRNHILLDASHQSLMRTFLLSRDEERIYILVFIPTASSSTSGGSFRVIDTAEDQLNEVGNFECSKFTAHCHLQDFMISGSTLYTLWDREGRSMVEKAIISVEMDSKQLQNSVWQCASYTHESELTPAYMDEGLLSVGSLTEKFLDAVTRPGVFSSLTLRTAIDQYIVACLSIPGTPPPQLTTAYSTISETIAAVVGCTVTLNRDPQTNVLLYANYWTALKRDWEGFVARCREVERSARRPLALGTYEQSQVVVVERERVGLLAKEDVPIYLRRLIIREYPLDRQFSLLSVLWTLRTKLGLQTMQSLENSVLEIMHQETAFSFVDILQEQAQRARFKELHEGSVSWLMGRLQSIGDLSTAVHTALDVIAGFEAEVKNEDDDTKHLLTFTPSSEWSRALTAAYVSTTIEARYDICLSLVILLFFLADELPNWDQSLLSEVFAVFRGTAMLQYVADQPTAELSKPVETGNSTTSPDDVVMQMRNMTVSQHKASLTSNYSLIYLLLAQAGRGFALPSDAHRFIDSSGILQSVSPAHAMKYEVMFCERLRLLGFNDASRELLSWLPRTPGVIYVLSLIWLNSGRPDDAAAFLDKLAGCFGPENSMTVDDRDALASVLPDAQLFDSEFSFYLYASSVFKNKNLIHHEVHFAQRAISVAPSSFDTSRIWHAVIRGLAELGLYEDAYASLMSSPHEKQKRELASQLTIKMCEESAVEKLMLFDFAGISDGVESALCFKARNVDPRHVPSFSKILYTWYIHRGDFRSASLIMYQHARKIRDVIIDQISFANLAEEQLNTLSIAINALSLVDQKSSWVLLPVSIDLSYQSRKRQKLSQHIPESKYASGKFDTEIVHLHDMQHDYALLKAQIDIIRQEPTLLSSPEFLLPSESIILRLTQANRFNVALATARTLDVDMADLFTRLTHQCIRLSKYPNLVMQEDTSDWLLTDKVSSWPGTPADRGWRYLRQSLERYDRSDTDYRYSKAACETILSSSSRTPPWLVHALEKHHPEYLIRTSLRYDNIDDAIDYSLSLLHKSDSKLIRDTSKQAFVTWLPYALIDQVLQAAEEEANPSKKLSELRMEISNRVKKLQKHSLSIRR